MTPEACGGPSTEPINVSGFIPWLQSLKLRPAGLLSLLPTHTAQNMVFSLAALPWPPDIALKCLTMSPTQGFTSYPLTGSP